MYFVSHVLRHKSHTFVCTLYHTCSGTNLTRLCVLCVARAQAQISHVCVYFVLHVLRHKSHTFVCTLCRACSGTNLTHLCVLCVARAQAQVSHVCVYFVSHVLRQTAWRWNASSWETYSTNAGSSCGRCACALLGALCAYCINDCWVLYLAVTASVIWKLCSGLLALTALLGFVSSDSTARVS
jgi:hypothetical protein